MLNEMVAEGTAIIEQGEEGPEISFTEQSREEDDRINVDATTLRSSH